MTDPLGGKMLTTKRGCEDLGEAFGLTKEREEEIQLKLKGMFADSVHKEGSASLLLERVWNDNSMAFEEKVVSTFWMGDLVVQWCQFMEKIKMGMGKHGE